MQENLAILHKLLASKGRQHASQEEVCLGAFPAYAGRNINLLGCSQTHCAHLSLHCGAAGDSQHDCATLHHKAPWASWGHLSKAYPGYKS